MFIHSSQSHQELIRSLTCVDICTVVYTSRNNRQLHQIMLTLIYKIYNLIYSKLKKNVFKKAINADDQHLSYR